MFLYVLFRNPEEYLICTKCHQDHFYSFKNRNFRDIIRIFREILRDLQIFTYKLETFANKGVQNAIKLETVISISVSRAMNENKCVLFQSLVFFII